MKKWNLSVKDIVWMAFFAALYAVLDILCKFVPLFQMPNGGSLNLASLAIFLCSYRMGWKKGLATGFLCFLINCITSTLYVPSLLGLVLDYIFPITIYGLASFFPTTYPIYWGVLICNALSLLSSVISGVYVWETAWWGSLTYNATWMIPTCIADMILVPILLKALKKAKA